MLGVLSALLRRYAFAECLSLPLSECKLHHRGWRQLLTYAYKYMLRNHLPLQKKRCVRFGSSAPDGVEHDQSKKLSMTTCGKQSSRLPTDNVVGIIPHVGLAAVFLQSRVAAMLHRKYATRYQIGTRWGETLELWRSRWGTPVSEDRKCGSISKICRHVLVGF